VKNAEMKEQLKEMAEKMARVEALLQAQHSGVMANKKEGISVDDVRKKKKKRKLSSSEDPRPKESTRNRQRKQQELQFSLPTFSWDGDLSVANTGMNGKDDVDDDDDDNVPPETVKSKKKRKRDEELMIQEHEKAQLSGSLDIETTADYERLVLQSPQSSLVWCRYLAHHVETADMERARAVAERALNTISFREEQEKLNVWLAYLNMETIYGDPENVKKVLARAIQYCEPLTVYLKQCDMYASAEKLEDAEQLYLLLTRKFKKEKQVWKSYVQFLFHSNRLQSARNQLQRCITVLEKKDHVEIITRFATLEFSHGDAERGRTMFENLISSYPGRTDLWSVYVDMLTKMGDIKGARLILERAVKLKLNAKRLASLLRKFVKFEESHGTEDQVQQVKDMAVELMQE